MKKVFLSVALLLCIADAKLLFATSVVADKYFYGLNAFKKNKLSIIFEDEKHCKVNHLKDEKLSLVDRLGV